MSAPPPAPPHQNNGNGSGGTAPLTPEGLMEWLGRQEHFNAMHAHPQYHTHPFQPQPLMPPMALPGVMQSIADPLNRYYAHFHEQQMTALMLQQLQAGSAQVQPMGMNYHRTQAHSQAQMNQPNQGIQLQQPSQMTIDKSLSEIETSWEETLKSKIARKIQDRLHEEHPVFPRVPSPDLIDGMLHSLQRVNDAYDDASQPRTTHSGSHTAQEAAANKKIAPVVYRDPNYDEKKRAAQLAATTDGHEKDMAEARAKARAMLEASTIEHSAEPAPGYFNLVTREDTEGKDNVVKPPPKKKKKTASPSKEKEVSQKKKGGSFEVISSKLDEMLEGLQDKNVRSAIEEDRDRNQMKRKEMRRIYDDQIKEMKARLDTYTKLEALSQQIVDDEMKSNPKRTRNNSTRNALDMIHLSLKNYRLLEDTSDHLLGIDKKE